VPPTSVQPDGPAVESIPVAPDPAAELNPAPPQLRLTPPELDLMRRLAPFIGSPRGAKRFANTYRLIRASLQPDEIEAFEGNDQSGGFAAVQLLLAILCGPSSRAARFFETLMASSPDSSWRSFVESTLGLAPPAEGARPPTGNRGSGPVSEWDALVEALRAFETTPNDGQMLTAMQMWAPRVARYSFQVGREGWPPTTSVAV
jgi:hypothetical protein